MSEIKAKAELSSLALKRGLQKSSRAAEEKPFLYFQLLEAVVFPSWLMPSSLQVLSLLSHGVLFYLFLSFFCLLLEFCH